MRPELRDRLIHRFEELMKWAGATDYDAGMQVVSRFFTIMLERIAPIRTKEDLTRLFNTMPDPSFVDEKLMLGTLRFFPQIFRVWTKQLAAKVEEEVPALPGGRPPVDVQKRAEVVGYVGGLHTRGCSLEISKKRAATRFNLSEGTVQRLWDDRGSMDVADFRSALKWISEGAM